MMDRHLRAQPSNGVSSPIVYHASASRTLQQANAVARSSSSSNPEIPGSSQDSQELLDFQTPARLSQDYPTDNCMMVRGQRFQVDFGHIYRKEERLESARIGFAVRYKSQLKGGREYAAIWQYGVELPYGEDNGSLTRLWLCRLCHLDQSRRDAKTVNSYHHITDHMRKLHAIDPKTGLAPISVQPASGSPWDAARAAGSNSVISHTPWQEESFQSAMVDWVILKDISFSDATSSGTRGLLTWNRTDLPPFQTMLRQR